MGPTGGGRANLRWYSVASAAGSPTCVVIEGAHHVGRTGLPRVITEVAPPRRLRMTDDGRTVLWAAGSATHWGLLIRRRSPFRIVAPITATEVRRMRESHPEPSPWWTAWALHFAAALGRHGAMIGPGRWEIQRAVVCEPQPWTPVVTIDGLPARTVDHVVAESETLPDALQLTWDIGDRPVLPMRTIAADDEGRTKAWAKAADDGSLAPLFLWWHSGLQAHVVIDGHVRLAAATREGAPIRALVLSAANPGIETPADEEARQRRLVEIERRIDDPVIRNRAIAKLYDAPPTIDERTRARLLPGGDAAWSTDVAAVDPGYLSAVRGWLAPS